MEGKLRTWVSKYGCPTKGTLKNADGRKHEARADLNERRLWWAVGFQRILFDYLTPQNK
jgi:hypothetical protein